MTESAKTESAGTKLLSSYAVTSSIETFTELARYIQSCESVIEAARAIRGVLTMGDSGSPMDELRAAVDSHDAAHPITAGNR